MLTVVCVAFVFDGNVWLTFSRRKWLCSVCDECVLLYRTCRQQRVRECKRARLRERRAYVGHLQGAAAQLPLVPTMGPARFENKGVSG